MKMRTIVSVSFIALLFLILIGRIVYFSVFKKDIYEKQVLTQQKYTSTTIPYKRGDILDRNGYILATSQKLYNLILEPKNILVNKEKKKATINALVKYMKLDREKLTDFIQAHPDSYYSVYKVDLSYSQVADIKSFMSTKDGENVTGVHLFEHYERKYPNKSMASQVIGFVSNENTGTGGIEQYYNSTLSGTDGRRYSYLNEELEKDSSVVEPQDGKTVVTTINSNIQKIAEKRLKKFEEKYGSKGSSILVMNPNNGEVYAMANSDTYDLEHPRDDSVLRQKYSKKEIASMSEKKKTKIFNEIWKNPIVSSTFEPGSTYKPFTVAAGLEEGILTGKESYICNGYQVVGGHTIHCSHRNGHGKITLSQAISLSCNDALMQIAAKEGKHVFCKYQRAFGFGSNTEIDLPAEAQTSGLLHSEENMGAADLATNSFGQSFNCSMIQLASGFCSLVNGGQYYKPHVVRQIRDEQGNIINNIEPSVVKQTISKDTSDKLKAYMKQTVDSGTGTDAKLKDYSVGGKTGTAEKIPRSKKKYVVSFIGFAPVKNPKVVVYVVIDEIQKGSQMNTKLAVKIAKDVLKGSLKELKVPKSK